MIELNIKVQQKLITHKIIVKYMEIKINTDYLVSLISLMVYSVVIFVR